jgi:hypothetical protein
LLLQNCNCANDVVVHDLHLSFLIASDFNQEILVQKFVILCYLFGAIFLEKKNCAKIYAIGCASLTICFFLMPSPNGAIFFSPTSLDVIYSCYIYLSSMKHDSWAQFSKQVKICRLPLKPNYGSISALTTLPSQIFEEEAYAPHKEYLMLVRLHCFIHI